MNLLYCKTKQGKHLAFFRKNSSVACFRSSLDNHQQQEVFIPVDVRGYCDFDYDMMSAVKKMVSFQSFPYIKVKHFKQRYFLQSCYNGNKQCKPPEEKTEEIKLPEEEIVIKESSKKKKRQREQQKTAEKLLKRLKKIKNLSDDDGEPNVFEVVYDER